MPVERGGSQAAAEEEFVANVAEDADAAQKVETPGGEANEESAEARGVGARGDSVSFSSSSVWKSSRGASPSLELRLGATAPLLRPRALSLPVRGLSEDFLQALEQLTDVPCFFSSGLVAASPESASDEAEQQRDSDLQGAGLATGAPAVLEAGGRRRERPGWAGRDVQPLPAARGHVRNPGRLFCCEGEPEKGLERDCSHAPRCAAGQSHVEPARGASGPAGGSARESWAAEGTLATFDFVAFCPLPSPACLGRRMWQSLQLLRGSCSEVQASAQASPSPAEGRLPPSVAASPAPPSQETATGSGDPAAPSSAPVSKRQARRERKRKATEEATPQRAFAGASSSQCVQMEHARLPAEMAGTQEPSNRTAKHQFALFRVEQRLNDARLFSARGRPERVRPHSLRVRTGFSCVAPSRREREEEDAARPAALRDRITVRLVDISLKQRLKEEEIYAAQPPLQLLLRRGFSLLEVVQYTARVSGRCERVPQSRSQELACSSEATRAPLHTDAETVAEDGAEGADALGDACEEKKKQRRETGVEKNDENPERHKEKRGGAADRKRRRASDGECVRGSEECQRHVTEATAEEEDVDDERSSGRAEAGEKEVPTPALADGTLRPAACASFAQPSPDISGAACDSPPASAFPGCPRPPSPSSCLPSSLSSACVPSMRKETDQLLVRMGLPKFFDLHLPLLSAFLICMHRQQSRGRVSSSAACEEAKQEAERVCPRVQVATQETERHPSGKPHDTKKELMGEMSRVARVDSRWHGVDRVNESLRRSRLVLAQTPRDPLALASSLRQAQREAEENLHRCKNRNPLCSQKPKAALGAASLAAAAASDPAADCSLSISASSPFASSLSREYLAGSPALATASSLDSSPSGASSSSIPPSSSSHACGGGFSREGAFSSETAQQPLESLFSQLPSYFSVEALQPSLLAAGQNSFRVMRQLAGRLHTALSLAEDARLLFESTEPRRDQGGALGETGQQPVEAASLDTAERQTRKGEGKCLRRARRSPCSSRSLSPPSLASSRAAAALPASLGASLSPFSVEVAVVEKVNGENAQVSFSPTLDAWCICSKNVSMVVPSRALICERGATREKNASGKEDSLCELRGLQSAREQGEETEAPQGLDATASAKGSLVHSGQRGDRDENAGGEAEMRQAHSPTAGALAEKVEGEVGESNKDIFDRKEPRYQYAIKVARAWRRLLAGRSSEQVTALQDFLSSHTIVGELVGCPDKQHFLAYSEASCRERAWLAGVAEEPVSSLPSGATTSGVCPWAPSSSPHLVFYAVVPHDGLQVCLPPSAALALLRETFRLPTARLFSAFAASSLVELLCGLQRLEERVFSSDVEQDGVGEGVVLYFTAPYPLAVSSLPASLSSPAASPAASPFPPAPSGAAPRPFAPPSALRVFPLVLGLTKVKSLGYVLRRRIREKLRHAIASSSLLALSPHLALESLSPRQELPPLTLSSLPGAPRASLQQAQALGDLATLSCRRKRKLRQLLAGRGRSAPGAAKRASLNTCMKDRPSPSSVLKEETPLESAGGEDEGRAAPGAEVDRALAGILRRFSAELRERQTRRKDACDACQGHEGDSTGSRNHPAEKRRETERKEALLPGDGQGGGKRVSDSDEELVESQPACRLLRTTGRSASSQRVDAAVAAWTAFAKVGSSSSTLASLEDRAEPWLVEFAQEAIGIFPSQPAFYSVIARVRSVLSAPSLSSPSSPASLRRVLQAKAAGGQVWGPGGRGGKTGGQAAPTETLECEGLENPAAHAQPSCVRDEAFRIILSLTLKYEDALLYAACLASAAIWRSHVHASGGASSALRAFPPSQLSPTASCASPPAEARTGRCGQHAGVERKAIPEQRVSDMSSRDLEALVDLRFLDFIDEAAEFRKAVDADGLCRGSSSASAPHRGGEKHEADHAELLAAVKSKDAQGARRESFYREEEPAGGCRRGGGDCRAADTLAQPCSSSSVVSLCPSSVSSLPLRKSRSWVGSPSLPSCAAAGSPLTVRLVVPPLSLSFRTYCRLRALAESRGLSLVVRHCGFEPCECDARDAVGSDWRAAADWCGPLPSCCASPSSLSSPPAAGTVVWGWGQGDGSDRGDELTADMRASLKNFALLCLLAEDERESNDEAASTTAGEGEGDAEALHCALPVKRQKQRRTHCAGLPNVNLQDDEAWSSCVSERQEAGQRRESEVTSPLVAAALRFCRVVEAERAEGESNELARARHEGGAHGRSEARRVGGERLLSSQLSCAHTHDSVSSGRKASEARVPTHADAKKNGRESHASRLQDVLVTDATVKFLRLLPPLLSSERLLHHVLMLLRFWRVVPTQLLETTGELDGVPRGSCVISQRPHVSKSPSVSSYTPRTQRPHQNPVFFIGAPLPGGEESSESRALKGPRRRVTGGLPPDAGDGPVEDAATSAGADACFRRFVEILDHVKLTIAPASGLRDMRTGDRHRPSLCGTSGLKGRRAGDSPGREKDADAAEGSGCVEPQNGCVCSSSRAVKCGGTDGRANAGMERSPTSASQPAETPCVQGSSGERDTPEAESQRKEQRPASQRANGEGDAPIATVTCILPVGFPGCGKSTTVMHFVRAAVANCLTKRKRDARESCSAESQEMVPADGRQASRWRREEDNTEQGRPQEGQRRTPSVDSQAETAGEPGRPTGDSGIQGEEAGAFGEGRARSTRWDGDWRADGPQLLLADAQAGDIAITVWNASSLHPQLVSEGKMRNPEPHAGEQGAEERIGGLCQTPQEAWPAAEGSSAPAPGEADIVFFVSSDEATGAALRRRGLQRRVPRSTSFQKAAQALGLARQEEEVPEIEAGEWDGVEIPQDVFRAAAREGARNLATSVDEFFNQLGERLLVQLRNLAEDERKDAAREGGQGKYSGDGQGDATQTAAEAGAGARGGERGECVARDDQRASAVPVHATPQVANRCGSNCGTQSIGDGQGAPGQGRMLWRPLRVLVLIDKNFPVEAIRKQAAVLQEHFAALNAKLNDAWAARVDGRLLGSAPGSQLHAGHPALSSPVCTGDAQPPLGREARMRTLIRGAVCLMTLPPDALPDGSLHGRFFAPPALPSSVSSSLPPALPPSALPWAFPWSLPTLRCCLRRVLSRTDHPTLQSHRRRAPESSSVHPFASLLPSRLAAGRPEGLSQSCPPAPGLPPVVALRGGPSGEVLRGDSNPACAVVNVFLSFVCLYWRQSLDTAELLRIPGVDAVLPCHSVWLAGGGEQRGAGYAGESGSEADAVIRRQALVLPPANREAECELLIATALQNMRPFDENRANTPLYERLISIICASPVPGIAGGDTEFAGEAQTVPVSLSSEARHAHEGAAGGSSHEGLAAHYPEASERHGSRVPTLALPADTAREASRQVETTFERLAREPHFGETFFNADVYGRAPRPSASHSRGHRDMRSSQGFHSQAWRQPPGASRRGERALQVPPFSQGGRYNGEARGTLGHVDPGLSSQGGGTGMQAAALQFGPGVVSAAHGELARAAVSYGSVVQPPRGLDCIPRRECGDDMPRQPHVGDRESIGGARGELARTSSFPAHPRGGWAGQDASHPSLRAQSGGPPVCDKRAFDGQRESERRLGLEEPQAAYASQVREQSLRDSERRLLDGSPGRQSEGSQGKGCGNGLCLSREAKAHILESWGEDDVEQQRDSWRPVDLPLPIYFSIDVQRHASMLFSLVATGLDRLRGEAELDALLLACERFSQLVRATLRCVAGLHVTSFFIGGGTLRVTQQQVDAAEGRAKQREKEARYHPQLISPQLALGSAEIPSSDFAGESPRAERGMPGETSPCARRERDGGARGGLHLSPRDAEFLAAVTASRRALGKSFSVQLSHIVFFGEGLVAAGVKPLAPLVLLANNFDSVENRSRSQARTPVASVAPASRTASFDSQREQASLNLEHRTQSSCAAFGLRKQVCGDVVFPGNPREASQAYGGTGQARSDGAAAVRLRKYVESGAASEQGSALGESDGLTPLPFGEGRYPHVSLMLAKHLKPTFSNVVMAAAATAQRVAQNQGLIRPNSMPIFNTGTEDGDGAQDVQPTQHLFSEVEEHSSDGAGQWILFKDALVSGRRDTVLIWCLPRPSVILEGVFVER
ncbi:hypothetical protein BESB_076030 [Besnoitia besnoiti]|uniref:Uncharacterized protein n=1 Tax=Besnoitia besnoiti TaxID=94643 RepID=A0A2A9MBU7_BESBE|nr:hypothetical protein BESB_076030 [Besnoitia besnoiti]PFH33386.1 hypothetical protein BESB_076030 [Besnoitia besnoiti]